MKVLFDSPKSPKAALTLAHGAGAGMRHPFMGALAEALCQAGVAVLRFEFPYMEQGKKRPDSPAVATRAVAEAVGLLREKASGLPLYAAGKSFGARMTTTAAAGGLLPEIRGIICYGFPLHPAGEPSTKRAEHLADVPMPVLFLQGTRDELSDQKLMQGVCKELKQATLRDIEAADHGFSVLKRSGRSDAEVLAELVSSTSDWLDR